ncbi:MAG TPA: hypothetical protein VGJ93_13235 [Desulfuromonadaceae bacterium]|jgi:probable HAF family extracellular repeat protein
MRHGSRIIVTVFLYFIVGQTALAYGAIKTIPLGTLGGRESTASAINKHGTVVGFSDTKVSYVEHGFIWKKGKMADLGSLGGSSRATAINNADEVIGYSFTSSGEYHAFIWKKGKMKDLGTLGGKFCRAIAINDAGVVVGESATTSGESHAFIWEKGKMKDLGTLGGNSSSATSINKHCEVVGWSNIASLSETKHLFIWKKGKMTDIGSLCSSGSSWPVALNKKGVITGEGICNNGLHSFIWSNGKATDLGSPSIGVQEVKYVRAVDMNDAAQIIGHYETSIGSGGSFVWDNGSMTTIKGMVFAINDRGEIAGFSSRSDAVSSRIDQGFIWRNGATIRLGSSSGRELTQAIALNDSGQVVGWRKKPQAPGSAGDLWLLPAQAILWEISDNAEPKR